VAGCERTRVVSKYRAAPGLIESNPVLDLGSEGLENQAGVVGKVGNKFLLVQEPSVTLVQLIWKIPVEKCDHWDDARFNEIINKFHVELQALLIDGVITATEGNKAGPKCIETSD
jgi:hypothetical protein